MSPRRIAFYGAAGGLFYAAALVALLPAPWMARTIERASEQSLVLRDPAGTMWSGSGRLYARERGGKLLDMGMLRWTTSRSAIFTGRLATDLALGGEASAAHLELSPWNAAVRGLKLELPASVVATAAPQLEALGPQGTIRIQSENLRFDGNSALGLASVEWRAARLARAPALEFGSHVARLRGGGGKVDIELATIEGPLRLTGGGTWTAERGLNVSGALEHGGDSPPAMASFLQGVCSEYRSGRCEFRLAR